MPRQKVAGKKQSTKASVASGSKASKTTTVSKMKAEKAIKKTAPAEGMKKKMRWRPGTVALREIKRY